MAYGKNAVGHDGNRGIRGDSAGPESGKMPDGFAASVNSLSAPQGKTLGQPSPNENRASRQDIPVGAEIPAEQYNFQSGGNAGHLGEATTLHPTLHDPNYPSLPDPTIAGGSGTTNQGPQGNPVNWDAVGPYEYPEFGDWPNRDASDPTKRLAQ